jgi:hypothetical protein
MWEPRRLTTLWASTACYRENFTFILKNSTVKGKKKLRGLSPQARTINDCGGFVALTTRHPLSAKVGTNFADKRRLLDLSVKGKVKVKLSQ